MKYVEIPTFVLPVVLDEDSRIHTDKHPFCVDNACPCHSDTEMIQERIKQPLRDGLLTSIEALRIYYGQQV